jgi:hypothetical protein
MYLLARSFPVRYIATTEMAVYDSIHPAPLIRRGVYLKQSPRVLTRGEGCIPQEPGDSLNGPILTKGFKV